MNIVNHLAWAHPLVQQWFVQQFGSPTEPQIHGWPQILAGTNTLISAPTGSGKTFAAFLACLDRLICKAITGTLSHEIEVLYVSPLKALGNDVQKNLLEPLHDIVKLAKKQRIAMAEINVMVRSGDTSAQERQAMLKHPPHILVTTPESLYILLTADKSRELLRTVSTVIIDEIHALADDKRGAHLALSLERLETTANHPPLRIGLSATQKPLERVAHFLVGNGRKTPAIINIGHVKHLELAVEVPKSELGAVATNQIWDEIYDRLAQLAEQNRSTLIFANTRRVAERAAHHLAERLGKDLVLAHHGSLSRKLRLTAETKLKKGELKALVATASLELGIDIGSVDLVCQLGSPRSIAVMLQRVGRAGHWRGAVSKGCIFATTRDELLECAAIVNAILDGDLDQLLIPHEPIDILAQQIVATCATEDWHIDALFELVRKAFHYQYLSREYFNEVIHMLSEGIAGSRGRYGAYLFYDRINGILKARRGSRLVAITSGGVIPDNALFTVKTEEPSITVGTLDEDFAVESNRGDIILLGSTSWKINRIESAKGLVIVEDAHGAPPSVPFWLGEAPERTAELSLRLSNLREFISSKLGESKMSLKKTEQWLMTYCKVDAYGAQQMIQYIRQGCAMLGAIPTQKRIIAERFFDESGGMQLIIHSPLGARINKAWGLALRKCFCRSFNVELQASATDNGINIALTEQHSFPLSDVFNFLSATTAKEIVVQAVLQSPLFPTRWRWDAIRSLALVRFRNGKKVPPHILRMRSEDLLAAVFPDAVACQDNLEGGEIQLPHHPLINEAMKDALNEALNIDGLLRLLTQIKNQEIECVAVDTSTPSVFAHEILNANPYAFLDDAPLEERRARAVEMRQTLPVHLVKELGRLDPQVINEVCQQAWPDVRNADELQDMLQTVIAFPAHYAVYQEAVNSWQPFMDELIKTGRAGVATYEDKTFWFAVEKAQTFAVIYPQALIPQQLKNIESQPLNRDEGILSMIRGWLYHLGPTSNSYLSDLLTLESSEIELVLLRLEANGLILRGIFAGNEIEEWCERRLLARIHRLTVAKLRQEIEPVKALQFVHWLLNWQHVASGTQLSGEQGLLAVIDQLQGFEIPAKAWEPYIFAKRIKNYEPMMLDKLCLMGVVGWGRLSSTMNPADTFVDGKRINPSSVAPITFFLRENSSWLVHIKEGISNEHLASLSYLAQDIYQYLFHNGASFFMDIVDGVRHLKSEVEMGLWELVTAGLVTADLFDNLRSIIDPKRRLLKKRRAMVRHQYSSGRWSLLKKSVHSFNFEQIEAMCWVLLKRYGVIFRDLLAREKNIPRWRELHTVFRILEDRGEIRGGRFVEGFLGEQFALPYAVESLRAIRHKQFAEETIEIAAVDPLNLSGFILPGPRISAISGGVVRLKRSDL
ncbi:MAG: DEAD/DEAH box helicase [Legionella sp.]|uniref:DEAD/DEAH box helicase n=1 Tax=Legionella sp. TaxID=459 RepID=UPI0039E3E124